MEDLWNGSSRALLRSRVQKVIQDDQVGTGDLKARYVSSGNVQIRWNRHTCAQCFRKSLIVLYLRAWDSATYGIGTLP